MALRLGTEVHQVAWQGEFFERQSLALVNRELSLALMGGGRFRLGIEPRDASPSAGDTDPRIAGLQARIGKAPAPRVTIRHFWPPDFSMPTTGRLVVIQPWEFGSLPRTWVRAIRASGCEVWVPSTFVRQCYIASGVSADQVVVVPNGVNIDRFNPSVKPLPVAGASGFRFLFVGGTIPRKGVDLLLKAYRQAFTRDDDVSLVIKDFGAATFYRNDNLGDTVRAAAADPTGPRIVYLNDDMSDDAVAGLYAACDCLVHPYRGEGFGLPIAEAMACGKPVICTRAGAAEDFTDPTTAYLVPSARVRFAEPHVDNLETVEHPWWVEPDVDALTEQMRRVRSDSAGARAVGERAAALIASRFTWNHAAVCAESRLAALCSETRAVAAGLPGISADDLYEAARAGEWTAALDAHRRMAPDVAGDWGVQNAVAVALFRTGRSAEARELLLRGVAEADQPRDLHHNLAYLLVEEGNSVEALRHLMAALRGGLSPADIDSTLQRARTAVVQEARKLRKDAEKSGRSAPPRLLELNGLIREVDGAVRSGVAALPTGTGLSVIMIARDEERFLEDCLRSVAGIADEIVLVDTGSTDATMEIARSHGARVIERPWADDFSEARNASLSAASGRWALWLDADERLAPGQAEQIRSLMREPDPKVGGYMVNLRNLRDLRPDGEVFWHRAVRLFRRVPEVRFEGRIHEQNAPSLERAGYQIRISPLQIDHLGYIADVFTERGKHERTVRMLQREVEECPVPSLRNFHLFNLGNAYFVRGDMHSAIPWLQRAADDAEINPEFAGILFVELASALSITGRHEESLRACDHAASRGIGHGALDFARGHAHFGLRQFDEALARFEAAVQYGSTSGNLPLGDPGATGYKALHGAATAALSLDRPADAAVMERRVLDERPEFLEGRLALAQALERLQEPAEALEHYRQILSQSPSLPAALDGFGRTLYATGEFAAAYPLLSAMAMRLSDSFEAYALLADCSARLGEHSAARDAYLTCRALSPAAVEVHVNLGATYRALGDPARAAACFQEAIDTDPTAANAYFHLADLLYEAHEYAPALQVASLGIEREPTHAPGYFVMANCCFRLGDPATAAAAYRQALALRPEYPEAAANLAVALEALPDEGAG